MTISLLRELSTTEISMVSGGKKKDDEKTPPKRVPRPLPREDANEPKEFPIFTRPGMKIAVTTRKIYINRFRENQKVVREIGFKIILDF